jgi:dephospho-CoA kinase
VEPHPDASSAEAPRRPLILGLTGGIASGKSTVGRMLEELGARVIDADQLAREVVEPGTPALAEIARAFGNDVLTADGQLDRKRLGERVFAAPDARRTLNSITHPRIAMLAAQRLEEAGAEGLHAIVYMAPLLVENGLHFMCERVAVVSLDEEVQRRRLIEREGLAAAEVDQRMRAQLPLADKLAVAHYVIDNGGTLEETRQQVAAMWSDFLAHVRGV